MKYMKASEVEAWTSAKQNLMNHPRYDSAAVVKFVDLRRQLILACQQSGVGLLLGSDAPQVFDVPGFSLHHELKYLVDSGITPYEALRTGTVNVARFYQRDDIGVVKKGAVADLVLLNGNPLTDINQSKNIEGVMVANQWLPKTYIEAALKKLLKKNRDKP
ncbi:MAG: amidohydrolase family protein [Bacteroidia bacterium]|nr:amidohydrolase family protein [Bacteroidia bacterium]